jgi:MYXO-CTERM domain-containing protein
LCEACGGTPPLQAKQEEWMRRISIFAAAAFAVLAPAASATTGTGPADTNYGTTSTAREDDDDFPWGLLGLLGLAGLVGRNRRDVRVDTRRDDTGPNTGTRL